MSFSSIPLAEAWDMEKCQVPLEESVGRYAAGFVNLYPPGIPVLVPGEIISPVLHEKMQKWIRMGLTVQGVEGGGSERYLEVLKTKEGDIRTGQCYCRSINPEYIWE